MTGDSVVQLTNHQHKLIEASASIRALPPERIDFLDAAQCQIGLPYRNPGDDVHQWDRKQGNASLRIEAGSSIKPATGDYKKLGLPFGEKPYRVHANTARFSDFI